MKRLVQCFLVSFFTMFMLTSFAVLAQTGPDLKLTNARRVMRPNFVSDPKFTASKSGRSDEDYPAGGFERTPYRPNESHGQAIFLEALALNTSSKTIKAITWEFIAYKDAQASEILSKVTLTNQVKIRPNQSKLLSNKTGVLDDAGLRMISKTPTPGLLSARAVRIEYSDGSVWLSN